MPQLSSRLGRHLKKTDKKRRFLRFSFCCVKRIVTPIPLWWLKITKWILVNYCWKRKQTLLSFTTCPHKFAFSCLNESYCFWILNDSVFIFFLKKSFNSDKLNWRETFHYSLTAIRIVVPFFCCHFSASGFLSSSLRNYDELSATSGKQAVHFQLKMYLLPNCLE